MKCISLFSIFFLLLNFEINSQELHIGKIEPPNWWTDHSYNDVQLVIYGKNLSDLNVQSSSTNISINKIIQTNNSNYAFVNISILPNAEPGEYQIRLSNQFGEELISYELLERDSSTYQHNGFSSEDVIYLIFPDRFVNGDTSNDIIFNDKEEFEFGSLNGRHGGDIQGIIDKLDYLKDLGITTIWSTPLNENNMYMSYHGYAATNLYKVDPRHGSNLLYKKLVKEAHKREIKVILDHVSNHIGINHAWIGNLPTETWLNGSPDSHLSAEHNKLAHVDIHASEKSKLNVVDGWFENYMPDLNQKDSLLAQYLIQNTIWWIEFSGIDGIREDTYPYSDQKFMADWAKEILKHYPNFNIVGEVWKGDPSVLAAFQKDSFFPKDFDTNLPVVTDFAFRDVIIDYLQGKSNLNAIYELFAKDFLYANPNNLLVFIDNHDTDRGMFAAKWNLHKFKVALTLTLTTRGIPQIFYGTEVGMDGGGHHGRIRAPFYGGFTADEQNLFSADGRTEEQNAVYNFTRSLLALRNKFEVLQTGKLTQYQPKDNIYVYIKSDCENKILFVINDSNNKNILDLVDYLFEPMVNIKLTELLNNKVLDLGNSSEILLNKKSISIYLIE